MSALSFQKVSYSGRHWHWSIFLQTCSLAFLAMICHTDPAPINRKLSKPSKHRHTMLLVPVYQEIPVGGNYHDRINYHYPICRFKRFVGGVPDCDDKIQHPHKMCDDYKTIIAY